MVIVNSGGLNVLIPAAACWKSFLSSGACLFNKKQPTCYSQTHHTYSHIDLAIGSSILSPSVEWEVDTNPYGSDNFPVTLRCLETGPSSSISCNKFRESGADWANFKEKSKLSYSTISHLGSFLTCHILESAQSAIPQASCGTSNLRRPWWNDECRLAQQTQNKAWDVLCRYPTAQKPWESASAKKPKETAEGHHPLILTPTQPRCGIE